MKQIILSCWLVGMIMQSAFGDIIYDATNIYKITAAAHPDHIDPEKKPAQPKLLVTDHSTRPPGYGIFTDSADIKPSKDKYQNYLTDGVAANPLDENSGNYIYTQFSIEKVEVKVLQTPN